MTTPDPPKGAERRAFWDRPWLFLIAGLAATAAAGLLNSDGDRASAGWVLLLGGLATARALTVRRPAATLVLTASLVPLLAAQAVDSSWDSVRLVCRVAAAVSVVAAGLLALPPRLQRLALSLLVLLHFGGIAAHIFSNPPPNSSPSWLASRFNFLLFKPYLEFLCLECNYGFYSQGDRPRTHLWFYVTYADGERRWIKTTGAHEGVTSLADIRLMDLAWEVERTESAPVSAELFASRKLAGKQFDPPMPEPDEQDYQEPTTYSKALLASIARHVAGNYPHPTHPEQPVTGVKIYRVAHTFLTPWDFRAGADPNDPTTYLACYQGDFKPNGQLQPTCSRMVRVGRQDVEVREDPLLYWLLRIEPQEDGSLIDYLQLHAERGK